MLSGTKNAVWECLPVCILASMRKLIESVKSAIWWWISSNQNNSSILIFNHLRLINYKWQFRTCLSLIGTFIQNLNWWQVGGTIITTSNNDAHLLTLFVSSDFSTAVAFSFVLQFRSLSPAFFSKGKEKCFARDCMHSLV